MPRPHDRDPHLASMQDELRVTINALNELYHPVHPADPERIAAFEERVAELKAAIIARRRSLAAGATATAGNA